MLSFAAFVPNSPLLFPTLNEKHLGEVEDTVKGLQELSEELYSIKPETILLLTDSETHYSDAFCVNVADPYVTDLSELGDLGYQKTYHPDFRFIDALQRAARKADIPLSLSTDHRLFYNAAVPLSYLSAHVQNIKIVPIAPAALDLKAHFTFGNALKQLVMESEKRIAVIAAGNTSHALSKDAPGGFHADSKIFEEKILSIIETRSTSGLLQIPAELRENAKETCSRELSMLFGILDGVAAKTVIVNYEKPFGVGELIVNFTL